MKIAAIVIVYHPKKDEFLYNLSTYYGAVDKVLVWLNSEDFWVRECEYGKDLIFMGEGKNEYMAKPLNSAIKWCMENGYDYLLTMDQDSSWVNCHEYVSWVKENHRDTVAIYAPDVNGQSKEWTTGTEEQNFNSVITSGSLCNVAIADRLGGFREDYQIYWIDEEYCQWARKNGYEIIVLPKYTIQQCFGNSSKTKWGFYTLNYSPKVYYFLVRNSMWLERNHFGSPSLCFDC